MYTRDRTGIAVRIPAPSATEPGAFASRAMAQASGAATAPVIANGSADAHATGPNAQMNGTWTSEASGIQWALLGIGRVGTAGIVPPTSGKIQMKSTENPWPDARDR